MNWKKNIIFKRSLSFKYNLYSTFWWLKRENETRILKKEISQYFVMYNNDIITSEIFSNSELVSLLNEATYIKIYKKDISNEVLSEINFFAEATNTKYNVRKENTYRFMLYFEKAFDEEMPDLYIKYAARFLTNELQIIHLCKWAYPSDRQNSIQLNWKPYSEEYYKFHE